MGYSHGNKWTHEQIVSSVLEVVGALELDRMPSKKECDEYYQNTALTNVISKRDGGWYKLANELGLGMKQCETEFGKKYERIAAIHLERLGFRVEKMTQNHPYDLLVDGCVKIDVKASHLYCGPNGSFYTFNLEKEHSTCDAAILYAIDETRVETRSWVIPSSVFQGKKQISIGLIKSKYNFYQDRWDYIRRISDFWRSLDDVKENEMKVL